MAKTTFIWTYFDFPKAQKKDDLDWIKMIRIKQATDYGQSPY
jgi:hypothetical protein